MKNLPEIFKGTAPSKSEIQEQCETIITTIVESGTVNPLRMATTMKALELAMKTIKSGIDSLILEEAEKYEGKSFDFDGHGIQIKETGTKYDYSLCNDPEYKKLIKTLEETTKAVKERETFLKTIKGSMTIVDDESGEVSQVMSPSKSSKTSVTITLKK